MTAQHFGRAAAFPSLAWLSISRTVGGCAISHSQDIERLDIPIRYSKPDHQVKTIQLSLINYKRPFQEKLVTRNSSLGGHDRVLLTTCQASPTCTTPRA